MKPTARSAAPPALLAVTPLSHLCSADLSDSSVYPSGYLCTCSPTTNPTKQDTELNNPDGEVALPTPLAVHVEGEGSSSGRQQPIADAVPGSLSPKTFGDQTAEVPRFALH